MVEMCIAQIDVQFFESRSRLQALGAEGDKVKRTSVVADTSFFLCTGAAWKCMVSLNLRQRR